MEHDRPGERNSPFQDYTHPNDRAPRTYECIIFFGRAFLNLFVLLHCHFYVLGQRPLFAAPLLDSHGNPKWRCKGSPVFPGFAVVNFAVLFRKP